MKVAIIEKNEQTNNILKSYLSDMADVELSGFYCDFQEDINYKELDLIIFDILEENSDIIIEKVKSLKNKFKNLNFIAMSYEINSELVSKTLNNGIQDFILKPILSGILEASIKKIKDKQNNIQSNLSKSICVYSPKGGVGKTAFSLNLAYELSSLTDNNVCLLDLASGDVSTYLNVQSKLSIDYILSKLEAADKELLLSMIPKYENKNFYVLSDPKFNSKLNPNEITKTINSLKNIFPYVIIDTQSVIDETILSVFNNSDVILLMALLTLASIKNCQRTIDLFNEIGYNSDKIKLIINRFSESESGNLKETEKTLAKKVFSKIPNNYLALIDAINLGQAVSKANPQSNIARAYKTIAQEILNLGFEDLDETTKYTFNHGIFNLLRRMGE